MTAVCGGGASAPKAGYANIVQVSAAGLAAIAVNWPVLWAIPFLVGLEALVLDLTQLCPTDPPADPGITYQDCIDASTPLLDPVAFAVASAKLYQLLKRFIWYQVCECTGASTPPPPAPPAPPAGITQINPPPLVNPKTYICQTNQYNVVIPFHNPVINTNWTPIPAGVVSWRVRSQLAGYNGTSGSTHACYVWFSNNAHAFLGAGVPIASSSGDVYDATLAAPPAGATHYELQLQTAFETGPETLIATIDFNCDGGGGGVTPCVSCPPDPVLTAQLQRILDYVKLIQRQNVPFAYIAGTAHAGLTNQGTIAVTGLLGVSCHLTTVPGGGRTIVSEPPYIYDLGWLSILTSDGVVDEKRIHAVDQVWTPHLMSEATILGYSFNPGVVATITELTREP